MRIIVSPAKKMREDGDALAWRDLPVLLPMAERLCGRMRGMTYAELKKLWKCSDKIAALNVERLGRMELRSRLTPAILAYEGIQYQYMAPEAFTDEELCYIQEHLRILSGFYGLLRPFDGVTPYRLEMQARLRTDFCTSLYDFWGPLLYEELTKDENVILNLASAEYSRCISRYVEGPVRMVDVIFAEQQPDGSLREKGVYVKMARGEMVRYLCENQVSDVEEIRQFDRMRYHFDPSRSDAHRYVFVR